MRPAARANRQPHRREAHALAAGEDPRVVAVDEARVGMRDEMSAQPIEVDAPRIVAALRTRMHVARLAEASQEAADRRLTHAE